jgi:hypothetical protein
MKRRTVFVLSETLVGLALAAPLSTSAALSSARPRLRSGPNWPPLDVDRLSISATDA